MCKLLLLVLVTLLAKSIDSLPVVSLTKDQLAQFKTTFTNNNLGTGWGQNFVNNNPGGFGTGQTFTNNNGGGFGQTFTNNNFGPGDHINNNNGNGGTTFTNNNVPFPSGSGTTVVNNNGGFGSGSLVLRPPNHAGLETRDVYLVIAGERVLIGHLYYKNNVLMSENIFSKYHNYWQQVRPNYV